MDDDSPLRAGAYALLGRLLSAPPDDAVLGALRAIEPVSVDPVPPLARSWLALSSAARLAPEVIQDEFHALFIGVTRGELLPYASFYRTGFLMEKPLVRARADLARLGIERRREVREPEDHAAALLEAMSLLVRDRDGRQKEFFDAHLDPWIDRFFDDLERAPSARFYRALARVGKGFTAVERTFLGSP